MSDQPPELTGPDAARGILLAKIPEGKLFAAHAAGKPIVLVREGNVVHAIGATCTHYGGPLAEGLLVEGTVRCPWHHACFSLKTGEAIRAPALKPVATWTVEHRDEKIFVTHEAEPGDGAASIRKRVRARTAPMSVLIIGGGAAGNAAAEMLRREGYDGAITMVTADDALPYDRPNLSKEYLSGKAPEDWIPLRSDDFYESHEITVIQGVRATALDITAKKVTLADGRTLEFDRLLLATGSDPVRLKLPGGDLPHVHYLRTIADSRALIKAAENAKRVLVMGASFIGLEVAASLRMRGLEVHVVAPERQPLEKIMGPELGAFIRALHEKQGVIFHLGETATIVEPGTVTLSGGTSIDADLVVIGVGVKPELALAEAAGLGMNRGVVVDAYLETTAAGIFAAGDIARWADPHSGEEIRVEHWVVAERQGQTAARNMLGMRERFTQVPFFWSAHYDTTICYVGHAENWDELVVDGDLAKSDATVTMRLSGEIVAVITVGRDLESLRAEAEMERAARASRQGRPTP